MKINLTTPEPAKSGAAGNAQPYDWQGLARTFGDTVKVAWVRAEFAVFRADMGTAPVPAGKTIAISGTGWLTVCHHGNGKGSHTGAVADRQVGRDRATWCADCKAGKAGTMPLVGSGAFDTPVEDAPATEPAQEPAQEPSTTTAEQAGPATPDAPAEKRELTTAEKRAVAKAQR